MPPEQLQLAPVHQGDPEESKAAARKVKAQAQLERVLICLYNASEPLTDDSIAARTGLIRTSAGTRRGVAVRQGWVERAGTGTSALGNPAARWRITNEGRDYIASRTSRRSA